MFIPMDNKDLQHCLWVFKIIRIFLFQYSALYRFKNINHRSVESFEMGFLLKWPSNRR